MVFQNTYRGFFYRQIFVTPALINPSTCSLIGKTGIVTGSNTGLGYHASLQLLNLGLSNLILAVRDSTRGEAAKKSLLAAIRQSEKKQPAIHVWPLDLTSYPSIVAFTQRLRDSPDIHIDFAILNAGVARFDFEEANGNELTIQTNWLGTALLAILLRPILHAQFNLNTRKSNGNTSSVPHTNGKSSSSPLPRPVISIVGSEVAQWAAFKEYKIAAKKGTSVLEMLNDEKNFDKGDRYYTSKLLLLFFFREVCNRLPTGNDVVVNLVNPGFCYGSELHRTLEGPVGKVFGGLKRAIGRPTPVGARTLVHGAVAAGNESHGCYLSDEKIAPFVDFAETKKGAELQSQMWNEMTVVLRSTIDVAEVMKQY